MQKDFLSFLKAIFIFSLILSVFIYLASLFFSSVKIDSITWIILSYFFILTLIFHYGLLRSSQGKPQGFIRYYMAATTFKLFVHIIVLSLYCLFNRQEAVRFIITFLIFYVLFTVFEVTLAAKKFKK